MLKRTTGEKIADTIIYLFLAVIMFVTLYPFIYVFSMSISDPGAVLRQEVLLWPKGISFEAYRLVFEEPQLFTAYYNTLWYTFVGTAINVFLTIVGGYPLSRKDFFLKNHLMFFVAFTMFFSGGMIPLFLLVNEIGLYDTRWAIVLPIAVSAFNLIIARVYFSSNIPDSLQESAKLEGCTDIGILFRIVVPLSAPIIAVVALFSAVLFWNSYFPALIYLSDQSKQPVTIYLRNILINQQNMSVVGTLPGKFEQDMVAKQLKYVLIIVTILPILTIYPFLQRYFVKGVLIGAIKE